MIGCTTTRVRRPQSGRLAAAASLALVLLGLAACTDSSDDASAASVAVAVTSSDDACELSVTTAAAGSIEFEVTNSGSKETEFYLYEADGTKVVGEVEDIGPGLSRSMTVKVGAGTYVAACKPSMTGDGIRSDFTVTGS